MGHAISWNGCPGRRMRHLHLFSFPGYLDHVQQYTRKPISGLAILDLDCEQSFCLYGHELLLYSVFFRRLARTIWYGQIVLTVILIIGIVVVLLLLGVPVAFSFGAGVVLM